jgi:hypothetical protein
MRKKPDYDRTKLPQWAQREFERIESNLHSAEKKMREMLGESNEGTEVFIWEGQEDIPLPARSQIRFLCEADDSYRHFDVSIRDGNLRIYGQGCFTVQPQSANSVELIHEDHRKK